MARSSCLMAGAVTLKQRGLSTSITLPRVNSWLSDGFLSLSFFLFLFLSLSLCLSLSLSFIVVSTCKLILMYPFNPTTEPAVHHPYRTYLLQHYAVLSTQYYTVISPQYSLHSTTHYCLLFSTTIPAVSRVC